MREPTTDRLPSNKNYAARFTEHVEVPMNFDLSEEHRMLRESVREFVAKEVAPRARHVDETSEFPWATRCTQ
jgi:hypothetical protein